MVYFKGKAILSSKYFGINFQSNQGNAPLKPYFSYKYKIFQSYQRKKVDNLPVSHTAAPSCSW
jgi:hypothetical protein